jgi:hypothetical protein
MSVSAQSMDEIVKGMEAFFITESDIEGITSKSPQPYEAPVPVGCTLGDGLNIDMEKVMSLLKGEELTTANNSSSTTSGLPIKPQVHASRGALKSEVVHVHSISSKSDEDDVSVESKADSFFDNNDGSSGDSENESASQAEEDDGESESDFYNEYAQAMEEELLGTSLDETFERRHNSDGTTGEVDVSLNLLKNLLESDAQNFGPAGPVSNLLSQLGVQLPRPPKIDPQT